MEEEIQNEELANKPKKTPKTKVKEVLESTVEEVIEPAVEVSETKDADMDLVTVSPVEFSSFDEQECHLSSNIKRNVDILQDVKMHITVELGRARCSVKRILDFNKGSIVELNKVAGEQVELYANGKFVAYGEVIVIEDKFGLRVTSIAAQNTQI